MCILSTLVVAQDAKFREDQLYFGIAYPYFASPPQGLIQNKLSYALSAGFVRDMPISKSRRLAIGLGLGWDMAQVFTNSRFQLVSGDISTTLLEERYTRNSLQMQSISIPLELRWRNASAQNHAFWRVHTGVSLQLPLDFNAIFEGLDGSVNKVTLPHTGSLMRWNLYLGFNTWNISITHDLQPWATFTHFGEKQDIIFTKIGLIFFVF